MFGTLPPFATLIVAITCEVFATSWLPKTDKFTHLLPTLAVATAYAIAFYALSLTIESMPLGIAYAIWCGTGIVLVASISWLLYGQALDGYALLGISLIVMGTIVINVFSKSVGS